MLIASSGGTVWVSVLLIVVVVLVVLVLSRSVRVIQQGTVGAVKRLGKYRPPVRQSGWTTVIPFLDTIQKVDVREEPRVGDMQQVITKDNVSVLVNATIYSQVIDVELALFEVSNYHVAVDQLARTALRAVFGGMTLDEALSERQRINAELQTHMASATEKWGVRLNRIEIVDIVPPQNILNAMALQKEADQQKRAAILTVRRSSAVGHQHGTGREASLDPPRRGRQAVGDPARRGRQGSCDPPRRGPGRALSRPPTPPSTPETSPPSCSPCCSSRPSARSPRATTQSWSFLTRPQGSSAPHRRFARSSQACPKAVEAPRPMADVRCLPRVGRDRRIRDGIETVGLQRAPRGERSRPGSGRRGRSAGSQSRAACPRTHRDPCCLGPTDRRWLTRSPRRAKRDLP